MKLAELPSNPSSSACAKVAFHETQRERQRGAYFPQQRVAEFLEFPGEERQMTVKRLMTCMQRS